MNAAAIRILHIEDDPLDAKLIQHTLAADGLMADIQVVDTRPELQRLLEPGAFDLVLSDFRLPGFDGREALAMCRERLADVPFIFVTGALGEEEAIALLKQGATDYILKSRLGRLPTAVRRALEEAAELRRRAAADRELRESNVRLTGVLESVTLLLERLFENTHVLIAHVDTAFRFLRVNRAYAQTNGEDAASFAGRSYFAVHADSTAQEIFQRVVATGEPYVARARAWRPLKARTRRDMYWDWSLQPVRNEHGQVEGLLLFLVDVTRRKQAQKARLASERRYRELVENVDSLILRWKPDGTITFVNRFARHFFGYPSGDWLGANVASLLFQDAQKALSPPSGGEHAVWERECIRRDGSRVWVRWTLSASRSDSGRAIEILSVGSDITEQRQREQAMQRAQQELRAFARTMGTTLHGRPMSPGLAEGTAYIYRPPEDEPSDEKPISAGDVPREVARFDRALTDSVSELEALRDRPSPPLAEEERTIVEAHLTMLRDAAFMDKCRQRVRQQLVRAEQAIDAETRDLERMIQSLGEDVMRERSADVRDVGRRVFAKLRREEAPTNPLASLPPGSVLVTERLLPSDTLQLDRRNVAAVVTERDGPSSHIAILARARGIPAVCDVRKATSLLATGDRLLVDAEAGTVTFAPTHTQAAHFTARREQYAALAALSGPGGDRGCVTRDGVGLRLYANIGRPDEVRLVQQYGLDGVGLFRSEYLFLDTDQPPSRSVQGKAYESVIRALQPRPVVIRTMDLGGDKVPRFAQPDDALRLRSGQRGIAYSLSEQKLFRIQLQAILEAAGEEPARIMFPMVRGVADLRDARAILDDVAASRAVSHRPLVGAMIETPSAVFQIDDLLRMVDFVSIGTNDLAQYTLALDRSSPDSGGALALLHPGVLRATEQVVRAAADQAVDLSVCGETAGDPGCACLLAGLGVRTLSMSPLRAPRVRQVLQQIQVSRLEAAAREALAAATPRDVQDILAAALRESGLEAAG